MADLIHFIRKIRSIQETLEIERIDRDRILLLISELGTNVIRHAGSGKVKVSFAPRKNAQLVFITAIDQGPGIPNLDQALKVGVSSKGSLGLGLPAIMAQLEVSKLKNRSPRGVTIAGIVRVGGNRIEPGRRYKSSLRRIEHGNGDTWPTVNGINLDISHYVETHPKETVCGDFVFRFVTPAGLVFGIFDGLGHGVTANAAAKRFEAAMRTCSKEIKRPQDFATALRTVDSHMTSGRSGVLGIVLALSASDIYFSRIGNISALLTGVASWSPAVVNGVLGDGSINKKIERISLQPGDTLVMHSDGLKSIHEKDVVLQGKYSSANLVARRLHEKNKRQYDDSSVIVARCHL